MSARLDVRLAFRCCNALAGTRAAALLISLYGLAYFLRIGVPQVPSARVWAVAKHVNARRQVERISVWVGAADCTAVPVGFAGAVTRLGILLSPGFWHGARRALRVLHRIERRHAFLVACRASAAIAWYARSTVMLARHRPGAVLVSSDSNPEEVGFTGAARALGIPQVFVAHAYPTPFSPRLDFSLSVLEGPAAVEARERRGPIGGAVVFAGVEGESAPLDVSRFLRPAPVIGIFTPKAVSWTTLSTVVADCRRRFHPSRIVIRWHPSRLDAARQFHSLGDMTGVEESSTSERLEDVARRCDWVIADENSNVHLPVLKLGIPTVAVKSLGLYPASRSDMYGFAASGVIFPPVTSLDQISLEAFSAFFSSGWVDRFRRYDASYMNPQEDVRAHVRTSIRELFEPPHALSHV